MSPGIEGEIVWQMEQEHTSTPGNSPRMIKSRGKYLSSNSASRSGNILEKIAERQFRYQMQSVFLRPR